MKKLILFICLLLPAFVASADEPLSRDLIAKLQGTMAQLENLENKFPGLKDEKLDANLFNTKTQLALIEAAGATDAIDKVVKSAGFDGIESFLGYAQRMTSSMFAVMKEQMPPGMNMDAMIKQQESALDAMKSSGMPAAALEEMKQGIKDMKTQASMMENAVAHAQPADVTFMRENLPWVMQQFESALGAN